MAEKFFSSPVVMDAIEDIVEMQAEVLLFSQYAEYASIEDQKKNLQLLRRLQSKQKNMCFRCILSDDPDAKALLEEVLKHFEAYGHHVNRDDPMAVFAEVEASLDDLEESLAFHDRFGYFPDEETGGETPPYQLQNCHTREPQAGSLYYYMNEAKITMNFFPILAALLIATPVQADIRDQYNQQRNEAQAQSDLNRRLYEKYAICYFDTLRSDKKASLSVDGAGNVWKIKQKYSLRYTAEYIGVFNESVFIENGQVWSYSNVNWLTDKKSDTVFRRYWCDV